MKYADFNKPEFLRIGEVSLDWVIKGEHKPRVEIFLHQKTNESFQVSELHNVYRKTDVPSNEYEVLPYKEWRDFD